jgi:hypothetical protein
VFGIKERAKDVAWFANRELELLDQKRVRSGAVLEAEKLAGDAFLDGDGNADSVNQVVRLRAEIDAIDRAVHSCRARRLDAIREKYRSDAKVLRLKAREKSAELTALESQTAEHLSALSSLEGVQFTEAILWRQPKGFDFGQPTGYHAPNSQRLRAEFADLEGKASELETREVSSTGGLDLESTTSSAEVILTALLHESESPSAETLQAWLDECEGSALRELKTAFGDRPRRVYVRWNAGAIDRDASHIFCVALAPVMSGPTMGNSGFNIERATFRSAEAMR